MVKGNAIYFPNYYKNQGYILGRTSTFCEKNRVFINNSSDLRWDHEGISIPWIKDIYQGFLLGKLTSLLKKKLFWEQIFEYH